MEEAGARQPQRAGPLLPDALSNFHPQTRFSLFEVNKSEWVEPAESTKTAATTVCVTPVPVDERTHFLANSEGLGGGLCPAGPQDPPCSSAVLADEPTLVPKEGNGPPELMDNPSAMGAESSSGTTSTQQEEQKGGERVVLGAQPDVESSEGAAVLSQVGLESCEPQQKQGEQVTGAAGSGV